MVNDSAIHCRSSVLHRVRYWTLYPYAVITFLWCAGLPTERFVFLLIAMTGFVAASGAVAVAVFCHRFDARKTIIDYDGVTIKDKKACTHKWDHIRGICVVKIGGNANAQYAEDQICIFLTPVKQKHINKMRNNCLYAVFHLKDFVLMDYDAALVDTLSKYSGLEISDQRLGSIWEKTER